MNVQTKTATIANTGTDDDFPGTFQVILSTPAKDRDGEELKHEEWQQPLPDKISFDTEHGMSVDTVVGSGAPYFDDQKRMVVDGTWSSLPKAQEVRTLVKEGHVNTVSVAFLRHKTAKAGGGTTVTRELLNGSFVAIPANPEAVVVSSKSGKRNSASDSTLIQNIHDAAAGLGADCGPMDDTGADEGTTGGKSIAGKAKAKYTAEELRDLLDKGQAYKNDNGDPSYPIADKEDLGNAIRAVGRGGTEHDDIRKYIIGRAKALGAEDEIPDTWNADGSITQPKRLTRLVAAKSVDGSYEQRSQAIDAALAGAYPGDNQWAYAIATFDDSVVYRVSGSGINTGQFQAPYTYENGTVTLGDPQKVDLVENVVPVKSYRVLKAATLDLEPPAAGADPVRLAQAVDAALDEAQNLLDGIDKTDMPASVAQAIDLTTSAWTSAGQLLEALGAYDPDADHDSGAAKSASAGGGTASAVAATPEGSTDTTVAQIEKHYQELELALAADLMRAEAEDES